MATLGQILGTDTTGAENRYLQQILASSALMPQAPTLQNIDLPLYGAGEQFQYIGNYTPEAMSATELRNLLVSPEMRAQELATLEQLNQIVTGQGLSDIDRARLAEIRAQQASQERGARQAILQNMAQRGMGGSGSELAAYLQAQQSAADRASLEGAQVAGEAQARQLEAGLQRAQLAGGIGERDYAREAQKAQAQDIINRFNVENRNLAQMSNLERQQAISNLNKQLAQANVDARQRQEIINKLEIPTSQYQMTAQQAGQRIGALQQAAGAQMSAAQRRADQMRQMIGTGIQAGATYLAGPAGGMMVGDKFYSYADNPGLQSRGSQLLGNITGGLGSLGNWFGGQAQAVANAKWGQPSNVATATQTKPGGK